jgi:colanic acid/amylovoran biosynthesis protein WcaK/AmsJ
MNENILIINIHSSQNLGDAALLNVTLQQFQSNFKSSEITLCIDDASSSQANLQKVDSLVTWTHPKNSDGTLRWDYGNIFWMLPATLLPILSHRIFHKSILFLTPKRIRPTIEGYIRADLVLSEPGGFLYSSGRGISLFLSVYSIALAILAKKPTYILPQSIGPFNHTWERQLVRWVMNRVRLVMVREPISLRTIKSIGVNQSHVHLVPDLAFALPGSQKQLGKQWLLDLGIDRQDERPLMGMTVVNWGEQNKNFTKQVEYENACTETIKWFINEYNGRIILFPQVIGPYISQDDRVPAHRIAQQLSEMSRSIYQIKQPLSLELLKAVYSCMDVFIGTRMHSNIFALSEGVPIIAIGYLHKTKGIAEMIGIEELFIDIGQVNGKVLIECLSNLWNNYEYWKAKIDHVVPGYYDEATKVGGWVRQDYEKWLQENNG